MNSLEIEWRHLDKDGKTCDRCSDTGETVRAACADLVRELEPKGWKVALKETLLTDQDDSGIEQHILQRHRHREAAARHP